MTQPLLPNPPGPYSPIKDSPAGTSKPTPNLLDTVRIGARLEAQVIQELPNDQADVRLRPLDGLGNWSNAIRANLITSNLDSNQLTAIRTMSNARVLAEVVSIRPALVLRLQQLDTTKLSVRGVPSTPGSREWLDSQFCRHLPQARPLGTTLQHWIENGSNRVAPLQSLGAITTAELAALKPLLGPILDTLPDIQDITDPGRLSQTLKCAGIWLEVNLTQDPLDPGFSETIDQDLKAQLLRIAARLRTMSANHAHATKNANAAEELPLEAISGKDQSSKEAPIVQSPIPDLRMLRALARDIDGMIKQIVTQQLQTLDSSSDQTRWFLELPVHAENGLLAIKADIRREKGTRRRPDNGWDLKLGIDLKTLGPLTIQLRLREDRLSASFNSASPSGAEILQRHLAELRRKLEERQLEVASLNASYRPDCQDDPLRDGDASLVSEQA